MIKGNNQGDRSDSFHPQEISRRDFLKLAAVTGLLAGCRPTQQPDATPVLSPELSQRAEGPTGEPIAAPTTTPTATPTPAPTLTPTPITEVRRPEIIKFYPDTPSKVVHTHHAGVWDDGTLVPGAIQQMLNASITELTGLNDATEAWATLFDPDERIAIKVNTIYPNSFQWTHIPLVMAVTERLQEVGVPAEQIVIFDRLRRELEGAGYPINGDGPGVRCYGTDGNYTVGWTIIDTDIGLSDILLSCDALINMPILKHHEYSGVTFAMKNHFGSFDRPSLFHAARTAPGIVELNALAPIRDRTRLGIGDTLEICPWSATRGDWHRAVTGDSILVSFDPVAHDVVGLQMLAGLMASEGCDAAAALDLATPWLASSAELGLGTNDLDNIELAEVNLG